MPPGRGLRVGVLAPAGLSLATTVGPAVLSPRQLASPLTTLCTLASRVAAETDAAKRTADGPADANARDRR